MKKTACIMFSVVFFLLCLIPGVGMLIRGPADLKAFMAEYDVKEEEIGQVW